MKHVRYDVSIDLTRWSEDE